MKFYFCRVYDGAFYHSGCTLHTLEDRILVKFLFTTYWDIPHSSITQVLLTKGVIRIEYENEKGASYIEVLTAFTLSNDKLKCELEKICKLLPEH